MKFRYISSAILIGVMVLTIMIIVQWEELPDRLRVGPPQGVPFQRSDTLVDREDGAVDTGYQKHNVVEKSTQPSIKQNPVTEALTRFINNNFEMAANLYNERLEIRKRRKPNGRYSAQDQKRLQEIHIAVYSHLKAIDDKIEGATQPYLTHQSGSVRCGYYLMPHKFKEHLGIVPEGYYLFREAIQPFFTNSKQQKIQKEK